MKQKFTWKTAIILIITLILLGFSLFPYYYMFIQSLMDWKMVDKQLFSTNLSLKSYQYLLANGNSSNPYMWLLALGNSLLVSIPTAIISILAGLFIGYSTSQVRFSGSKMVYNSLLFQMFFPTIILLVPRYLLMKNFANTYAGMILPLCVTLWAIFMYINYFKTLPDSVFEAARIDGANEGKILFYLGIPFAKSVTTIVFLTTFMTRWSELMWDMIISPKISHQTLNVLISTQFKPMGNMPGPMYAASVILTLPIIVLFLAFSKYFRDGVNFMLK